MKGVVTTFNDMTSSRGMGAENFLWHLVIITHNISRHGNPDNMSDSCFGGSCVRK